MEKELKEIENVIKIAKRKAKEKDIKGLKMFLFIAKTNIQNLDKTL